MTGRVSLALGEHRVKVSREDLVSKSEYFAALFSPNFSDHQNSEHRINYDIHIDTLRTFVDWVSDSVASVIGDRRHTKPSLVKYIRDSADFESLLQLLQLSVLFSSETLIKDLTDLITYHWLIPQKCVQIWLLAKELNVTTLRDLAKATCIDCLREVPESLLLELPGTEFVELLGNIRVKFTPTFPFELVQRWVDRHVPSGVRNTFDAQYPFTLLQDHIAYDSSEIKKMYEDQYWKHNIQCIVGYKRIGTNKATPFIFAWDGTRVFEVAKLPNSSSNIRGMQATGRGFNIYLVGGEFENVPGKFQTEIWRYSLISKTWYYVTSMPRPRKYMAIYFLNENLFVMGGRQSDETGIATIDVYNINTGQWKDVPHIQGFISVDAVMCERQGSLLVWERHELHSYIEDKNLWVYTDAALLGVDVDGAIDHIDDTEDESGDPYIYPRLFMTHGNYMYVLGSYWEDDILKVFSVDNLKSCPIHSVHIADCVASFDNQVSNGPYLVGFAQKEEKICVQVIKMIDDRSLESKIIYEERITSENEHICIVDQIGCFNVYNPTSLNKLFALKKKSK